MPMTTEQIVERLNLILSGANWVASCEEEAAKLTSGIKELVAELEAPS